MNDSIQETIMETTTINRDSLVHRHFIYDVPVDPGGTVPLLLYGETLRAGLLLATDPTSGEPFEIADADLPNVREVVDEHTASLLIEYAVSTFGCKLTDFFEEIEESVRDSRVSAPWLATRTPRP